MTKSQRGCAHAELSAVVSLAEGPGKVPPGHRWVFLTMLSCGEKLNEIYEILWKFGIL
jgi:hypothetical protein